jgi:hypothetical protein
VRATGAVAAVAVAVLLVQMQLQLVVSAAMEDRVRLRAHQLLMQVVVAVEVDPIPIRQLPVVQVVQVAVVLEQHRRDPHAFLKMEQMEVRTSVVVAVLPVIALPQTHKALEVPADQELLLFNTPLTQLPQLSLRLLHSRQQRTSRPQQLLQLFVCQNLQP